MRTCAVTGLRVEWHAETLIKVNAVVAVVNFLVGIVAAFGLVMTRWQAVHLLPADLFYRFLTLHGLNMLIFFIIFFEMAVLYFAGPVLLSCRLPAPAWGWLSPNTNRYSLIPRIGTLMIRSLSRPMIDSSEMMSAMLSRIASRSLSRWRWRSPALRSDRNASEEE